jgi:hypothetical protein
MFQDYAVALAGIEVVHQIHYSVVEGQPDASTLVPHLHPERRRQVYFHQTLGQEDS